MFLKTFLINSIDNYQWHSNFQKLLSLCFMITEKLYFPRNIFINIAAYFILSLASPLHSQSCFACRIHISRENRSLITLRSFESERRAFVSIVRRINKEKKNLLCLRKRSREKESNAKPFALMCYFAWKWFHSLQASTPRRNRKAIFLLQVGFFMEIR